MAVTTFVKSANLGIKYKESVPFQPDKFKYPVRRYSLENQEATDEQIYQAGMAISELSSKTVEDLFKDKTEIFRNL